MTPEQLNHWMLWWTDERLRRLNAIRRKNMALPLDKEQAARHMLAMTEAERDQIKEAMAE